MNPNQLQRLKEQQERIAEVLLDEMDPDNWSGAGKCLAEMSKEERGGRAFDKKNAALTMMLYVDGQKLIDNSKASLGRDPYEGKEMDDKIAEREREASKIIEDLQKRSKLPSTAR